MSWSLATASIKARVMRSAIAASVGSTSMAWRPSLRMASSCRGEDEATRMATSPAQTERTKFPLHGPFGHDQHTRCTQSHGGLAGQRQDRQGRGRLGDKVGRHGVRPRSDDELPNGIDAVARSKGLIPDWPARSGGLCEPVRHEPAASSRLNSDREPPLTSSGPLPS